MSAFAVSDRAVVSADDRLLHAAVVAYLGRNRGQSRLHTGSDMRIFLTWCTGQELDPLQVGRGDIERYVRWLQEVRCYQPSTVSRPRARSRPARGTAELSALDHAELSALDHADDSARYEPSMSRPNCSSVAVLAALVDCFADFVLEVCGENFGDGLLVGVVWQVRVSGRSRSIVSVGQVLVLVFQDSAACRRALTASWWRPSSSRSTPNWW
jgi:hypothetical protein